MTSSHTIEVRFGKLFEQNWHIVTYHITADTREEARSKAKRMAKKWASNPHNRVESGAFSVRK